MLDNQSESNQAILPETELPHLTAFYNATTSHSTWCSRQYRKWLARYYTRWIPEHSKVLEIGCGDGELLSYLTNYTLTGVDLSQTQLSLAQAKIPSGTFFLQTAEHLTLNETFDYIILSETINQAADVQRIFYNIHKVSHKRTRLILNFYNASWRPLLQLATLLKLKNKQPPSNWLNRDDVEDMLYLTDWELLKEQRRILLPIKFFGLDSIINRYIAPFLPAFCLTTFHIARPKITTPSYQDSTVSVVIPARNEAGNIANAVRRMPKLGSHTEIIFIEGHSSDNTWNEIQTVAQEQSFQWDITILQQTGKGKGNAVHEAFEIAKGDILIILDADLTVSPEELPKFYEALVNGKAEFCNGVRLVYPMEKKAMRFFNLCANKFFSAAFTWALDHPIKDTLCGTKTLFKKDYLRIKANRSFFGDFDPFGDFDLLFGADHLLLKIVDIPIRYRDRTYGSTNISRWKHGILLFKMLLIAIKKLKLG